MKKHVTKNPKWDKWKMTEGNDSNYNKAKEGLIEWVQIKLKHQDNFALTKLTLLSLTSRYMNNHKDDALKVAGELYELFRGYDPEAFSPERKAAWEKDLKDGYTDTAKG